MDSNNLHLSGLELIIDTLPRDNSNVLFHRLNLRDIQQLRLCNRRLGRSQELMDLVRKPGHLNRLGARCQGVKYRRFGMWGGIGRHACTNGPTSTCQIKYCEDHPSNDHHNIFESCTGVAVMDGPWMHSVLQMSGLVEVQGQMFKWDGGLYPMRVCDDCSADMIRTYPEGCNTCTCLGELRRGWKCHPCVCEIYELLYNRGHAQHVALRKLHPEDGGPPIRDICANPFSANKTVCPSCKSIDTLRSKLTGTYGFICLACDGTIFNPIMCRTREDRKLDPSQTQESR